MARNETGTQPLSRKARVEAQTEIRRQLLANGYVPLANKDKMCVLPRWNMLEVDEAKIDDWSDSLKWQATGVRVQDGLVALDFDVDDAEALDRIWEALPDHLFDVVDRAPVRMGKGDKICLFVRLAEGETAFGCIRSGAYWKTAGEAESGDLGVLHKLECFGGASARQIGAFGAHTLGDDGDIRVWYRWVGGRDLCSVPLDQLPVVTVEDVMTLAGVVTRVMDDMGWAHETSVKAGRVAETQVFDLDDEMMFDTLDHGVLGLEDLEKVARFEDGSLRCSASWLEGVSARNQTRCLVSINPGDGRVQVYETAGGVLHRPRSLDVRGVFERLGQVLQARGLMNSVGGVGGAVSDDAAMRYVSDWTPVDDEGRLRVSLDDGELVDAVELVAAHLAGLSHLYLSGGSICVVYDGRAIEMSEYRLAVEIGRHVECVKSSKKHGVVAVDVPMALVRQVASLAAEVGFRRLRGVTDMPVVARDGAIVDVDGWDAGSELLLETGGAYEGLVPVSPQRADAMAAVDLLLRPFRGFPLDGPESRGALLAALMTAVLRPGLATAPGFAFDAPAAGSGKTLMALCVGALGGGAALHAPLPTRNEEEIAKVMFSVLAAGHRGVLFDNQIGLVDSAALAAILTSESYEGRVLGSSRTARYETNRLFMFSGNNIAIVGDTTRRVLVVRIDAGVEAPASRVFDFDPLVEVRTNRAAMVAAVLTLVRWAAPLRGDGRVGSFEAWDQAVAQTIRALGRDDIADPADVLRRGVDDDPVKEENMVLLDALHGLFGDEWFQASEVVARLNMNAAGAGPVRECLDGVLKGVTSLSVSRFLRFRKDTRVGGMTLQMSVDKSVKARRVVRFRVVGGGNKVVNLDARREALSRLTPPDDPDKHS